VQCAESLRVQAYFDSEVDAVSAAEIERHLEHCAECRALLADLEQVRGVLRREADYARTPPLLRARVASALDEETEARRRKPRPLKVWRAASFWAGAAGGIGGTAIAATVAFLLLAPPLFNPLVNDLVSAHVRSLLPAHLIDVVSTDKHTVKPWFAGHADVSPVVADFEPQGYKLIGGRADYLDRQRAAVVVYQHGAHVINVFSWAAPPSRQLPGDTTRNGYHLAFWRQGDIEYCAVSDTGWDELSGLVRLLRSASSREGS
jgi:anti-sigma factor RsiW